MGALLVGAALHPHWSKLAPTERNVLITMAHTALDKPRGDRPRATYFGGHEFLCIVIFGGLSPRGSKEYERTKRAVTRAIQALISAGAIERTERGRNGSRASYRLTLDEFNQPDLFDLEPVDK